MEDEYDAYKDLKEDGTMCYKCGGIISDMWEQGKRTLKKAPGKKRMCEVCDPPKEKEENKSSQSGKPSDKAMDEYQKYLEGPDVDEDEEYWGTIFA